MTRRLIIDGNAVYELDEESMVQKNMDKNIKKDEMVNDKSSCKEEPNIEMQN